MVGGTQGTPHQDWIWYTPGRSGWWGVPPWQVWMVGGTQGTPPPGLDGVTPCPGMDGGGYQRYPPPIGQSSIASTCYMAGGVPPPPKPIRQSSIASTCYAASGVPLGFNVGGLSYLTKKSQKTYVKGFCDVPKVLLSSMH